MPSSNTAMPAEFLMQQMEWREALDEAHDEESIDRLRPRWRPAAPARWRRSSG